MLRNLKTLGLALVAVVAMSAVVASAASAVPSFTCAAYPCTVTGSNTAGNETLTTPGGTVQCDSHFQGTATAASSTLSITPSYDPNCRAFGFFGAVHENGCSYLFHALSQIGAGHYNHSVDVVCPAGKAIVITGGTCEVDIPAQTGLSSITTQNLANGTITVVPNISNITLNVTKDGFGCPFPGLGHYKGTYHGDVVFSSSVLIATSGS
jgi:hypothetical protein